MNMDAWIQSSDFSHTDLKDIGSEEAVDVFVKHDWHAELKKEQLLSSQGKESCPAGLGLMHPKGHIMHICPGEKDDNMIHYQLKYRVPFLWFFSRIRQTSDTHHGISKENVIVLIHKFFSEEALNALT